MIADSISFELGIESALWPENSSVSGEACLVQQRNSKDCGTFTMLNGFSTSRSARHSKFFLNDVNSKIYRFTIALCPIECNLSFLLEKILLFTPLSFFSSSFKARSVFLDCDFLQKSLSLIGLLSIYYWVGIIYYTINLIILQ